MSNAPPTHKVKLHDPELSFSRIGEILGCVPGSDITGCYYEGRTIIARKMSGGVVQLYLDNQPRAESIISVASDIGIVQENLE